MAESMRGICGQEGCRETRYYIENGLWFCRQGHQQQGQEVVVDDENFGGHGRTARRKKVQAERRSKTYHGSDAFQLFLEAYQLLLWKQCHALVHGKGLPSELEGIVKDLWILRLEKIYEGRDDIYTDDENSTQLFSSQTGVSSELDKEEYQYHKRKLSTSPRVIDSLALCYLGTLLLRLPVSIGYMQEWVAEDEIPFMRPLRFIPSDMKDRLPAIYHMAFDTKNLPVGDQIHRAVADLIVLYHRDFSIEFPAINSSLLLFSYVKKLALPSKLTDKGLLL
ncbi:hypothetical protein H112_03573 [Trichophyton rubrum D6]|uniref:Uncharacterized protein n=3 Tax=Trichophyton TaxID=5550 RepID=A0A080WNG5_TRIRC|nr:uncharacterized protein TERG_12204 [Trichophyton rubrum CBS 118892]EZF23793.1 hypothetical protein H100_03578 [Trichophyton rubrum MR850]EZF42859.1 hypothetical protein H102_03571 [Trichophyton rubrum CBS 100081]EZF53488.1 hypothetical protein H103_03581 [Trichophyton rubrum CBS 288.86]EZF64106.1 hypothetical protein H104_03568 [Trichophyton rubrum CBS 289.86]EZF74710.1 hypothetical protein H105_03596 [Trichophyton soudanense CBS 452.61]EZF85401.1 hypothetical protein H110_03580 [Trichophy